MGVAANDKPVSFVTPQELGGALLRLAFPWIEVTCTIENWANVQWHVIDDGADHGLRSGKNLAFVRDFDSNRVSIPAPPCWAVTLVVGKLT